jgi:hypothetical protein
VLALAQTGTVAQGDMHGFVAESASNVHGSIARPIRAMESSSNMGSSAQDGHDKGSQGLNRSCLAGNDLTGPTWEPTSNRGEHNRRCCDAGLPNGELAARAFTDFCTQCFLNFISPAHHLIGPNHCG